MNDSEILYRAAEIKQQLTLLEAEYHMLMPTIIKQVKELSHNKDKYALQVGEFGIFSIVTKKKYEYTPTTQNMEAEIKQRKKTEEATGEAKIISTLEFPQFRPLKHDA